MMAPCPRNPTVLAGRGAGMPGSTGSFENVIRSLRSASTIARTRGRLALVEDLLGQGSASLLSVHRLVQVFPEEDHSIIRDLIDCQLTDQIDCRVVDNYLSAHSHQALGSAVYALEPRTRREDAVYEQVVRVCIDTGSNRALVETTTGPALSPIE